MDSIGEDDGRNVLRGAEEVATSGSMDIADEDGGVSDLAVEYSTEYIGEAPHLDVQQNTSLSYIADLLAKRKSSRYEKTPTLSRVTNEAKLMLAASELLCTKIREETQKNVKLQERYRELCKQRDHARQVTARSSQET